MSDVRMHQAMVRKAMAETKKKSKGAAISLYGHKKAIKMFQGNQKKVRGEKNG